MTEFRLADEQVVQLADLISARLIAEQRPRLLDAKQAAERLGVPESWIRREAQADRLPHVHLGHYLRFQPDELEAWWRKRSEGPSHSAQRPGLRAA